MCGIFGIVNLKVSSRPAEELLDRMGKVIVHRGPNDSGHYCDDLIALGMRRLSIIDVAGGRQPIPNEDETVWVVCNGEIYNFQELRAELAAKGHVFKCNSDTEVIVHLYEEVGLELFKRLRGMFGIAIWDVRRSRLVLGRDRLGKKPLYICREPNRFIFASEIKSILEVTTAPRQINTHALPEYLALGYVPAPATMFEGIDKVLPGHYVIIDQDCIKQQPYWDVPMHTVDSYSEREWIERVREKLLESVRIRLISDVPLGAFLSGGLDSSSIVAVMAGMMDQPVKTYSIGFEGKDHFYNELPYANLVAQKFSTDHHQIMVRPEIAKLVPNLMWHLEEPIADSAFLTTYLVAKLAKESVTVILSGVGGDELFGGYRRYLGNTLSAHYGKLPGIVRKKWIPNLIASLPQDRHSNVKNYFRYADAFVKSAEASPALRYMAYVTLFSPEWQRSLLLEEPSGMSTHDGFASLVMKRYFEAQGDLIGLNQLINIDLKTSLPDDLLALTDKMTMAVSLECRAPFVDQELVELAGSMPDSFKVRGLTLKYLLKKVVKPWLPSEILTRKKRGFGAPVGSWIRNELGPLLDSFLSESQVKSRGLFNWSPIHELLGKHKSQKADYTDHLFALINLELWCQIFIDRRDPAEIEEMVSTA